MRAPLLVLIALLAPLSAPARAADDGPPRIVVTATASVPSPPDRAEIAFTVRGEGPTSDDAVRALVATRARIEGGLAALAAAPQPKVRQITVDEVRGRDCQRYGAPRLSVGECAIAGYTAELSLEVRTAAVKDAGTMVGLVGRLGGLNPRLERFSLANDADARRRAIAAALADARGQAEAIAAGTHVHLGALLSASDAGYGERPQVDEVIVTGTRVPPPPPPPPPPIPVSLAPQPIETQARVTVSYAIAP